MTHKDEQNINNEKSKSLIITLLNRLAAFIYSLFIDTWIGRRLMYAEAVYDDSAIGKAFAGEMKKTDKTNTFKNRIATVLENGLIAKITRKLSRFLANICVNVYGVFFAVYSVVAIITYFVAVYALSNPTQITESRLIACIVIVICSIPFMASSKSVLEIFGSGRLARAIATDYLCIPKEKLVSKKKIGGTFLMLLAATFGLVLGGLSFYVSPVIVITAFFLINIMFLVFAMPEIGVLILVTALPFMQYIRFADFILASFILFCAFAYFIKVLRGNRAFRISSPGIMVILYCISCIISSSFSPMGVKPLISSLWIVVIVAGGFFIGSNLTYKSSIRNVCIRVLTISLVLLAMLQFLNMYYMSISSGIEYSLNFNYRSIIADAGINVIYNLRLPGLLAAMLSPLLIAECFRQRRIYNIVTIILCFIPVILSIALYGTFEIMIALILGVVLYIVMYSHKTLTVAILLAIPTATVVMIAPTILNFLGVRDVPTYAKIVSFIFPDNQNITVIRASVISDIGKMLLDGNLAGIGAGQDTLKQALAPYASALSESATDAGTTYMQVLCESGILGGALFCVFSFLLVKHSLKFVVSKTDNEERITTLALLCGFVTAILLGSICCIFEGMQMRFLFWLCAGMLQGQIMNRKERERVNKSGMENNCLNSNLSVSM